MKNRNRLGLVALLSAVAVTLSGCALPYQSQIVEGTEVTVAFNQAFDNYNTGSSAGNATKNANITYMTNSGFQYYNSVPQLVKDTGYGTFEKLMVLRLMEQTCFWHGQHLLAHSQRPRLNFPQRPLLDLS
jgi:hypothetical protein